MKEPAPSGAEGAGLGARHHRQGTASKTTVGPPIFTSDRLYEVTPPGVAMGLAWTQMGGAAMYVESILQSALRPATRPSMEITGNLKTVMKESSTIAYSFAKAVMAKEFPGNHFFERAKIHIHVPEGAVQKDGPSAGITMATLAALAGTGHARRPHRGHDGRADPDRARSSGLEGLREKTVAARRAGCKMIIFPEDNMSDWLELPEVSWPPPLAPPPPHPPWLLPATTEAGAASWKSGKGANWWNRTSRKHRGTAGKLVL